MSTAEVYFHETWLGMVQPIEGLVVSLPVLVAAVVEYDETWFQGTWVEWEATREGRQEELLCVVPHSR